MKRKFLSCLLCLVMVLALLPTAALAAGEVVASGYCGGEGDGKNLSWTLTADGTLTISGTGEMPNYEYYSPWWDYNQKIATIVIQEGVTTIGKGNFYRSTALTSVTIPASVTTIGDEAFAYCDALTNFTVAEDNPAYIAVDGVLFNKDKTTLIQYPLGKTQDTYAVPDGVVTIDDSAFLNCNTLTSVTLPESLTTIGYYAFEDCDALTGVTFPEGLTTIGNLAFCGCNALTSVTIPASLTTIGARAFSSCDALTSFTVAEDNPAYTAVDGVLFSKDMTTLIKYPTANSRTTYKVPDGVTTIVDGAFSGCAALSDVTFPDGLTTINENAFSGCDALTSVVFPEGLTTIGEYAFYRCGVLTSVTLPASLPNIGNFAFAECNVLTDVTLPEGLTNIGQGAFTGCILLESVTIPASVTNIGLGAFGGGDIADAEISVKFLGDVPQISHYSGPFNSRILTAYYPEGNSTWTEEAKERLAYGASDVTWIPFDVSAFQPATYTVTVTTAQHGKVTADPTSGMAGTKVTLTVTPDSGYELDTLIVKQSDGKTVTVTNNTFTMPASDVTVSATFKALPVDRLSLSKSAVSVSVGSSASVTATVSGYAGKHVYAISSDASVATASVSGKTVRVKGVAQGSATVYVAMTDAVSLTLEQAKADPSVKEIKVTVTKASSSTGGGGGSTGGGGGSTGGGSTGGSTGGTTGGSSGSTGGGTGSTTPTTPATQIFTDVAKGSWYEAGVTFVTEKGLFNGVGANQFAPQQNMTRGMLMTVLARLAGQSTDGGAAWYSKGMDWAKAQGVSDGTNPEGNITREQLVTMLYRYAKSPAVDAAMGMAGFVDAESISDWAADAMRWAVQNGILAGKDGARLDPQGTATRAEVATILQRYVEKG